MNQGKLKVVKQEMARVNIDILGISELIGYTSIQNKKFKVWNKDSEIRQTEKDKYHMISFICVTYKTKQVKQQY